MSERIFVHSGSIYHLHLLCNLIVALFMYYVHQKYRVKDLSPVTNLYRPRIFYSNPILSSRLYLAEFGIKERHSTSSRRTNLSHQPGVMNTFAKFRFGAEQYTYKTVERRISTASVALGLARTSMPGRQHHLTNLKKYTRYSVVVQAFNALGPGPMTQEVQATTLEDGKRPWKPHRPASTSRSTSVRRGYNEKNKMPLISIKLQLFAALTVSTKRRIVIATCI